MIKIVFPLILLLVSFSIVSQVPTDSLVGYWPFNDNFEDVSGYDNHGISTGCTFTFDRFNHPNSAVDFNGIDDIIYVPNDPSISFDAYTEDFTISFWFRSNDPILSATSARFIDKWNGTLWTPYPHNIIIYGDSIKTSTYDSNTASQPRAIGIFNDKWYHVVMVNDIGCDSIKLYIDAQLTDMIENNTNSYSGNDEDVTFGNNSLENRPYHGAMDDIRFYSRLLNQSEITELYEEDPYLSVEKINFDFFIQITPNPINDIINVKTNFVIDKIEIYDITGRKVLITENTTVDLSGLRDGIYFIKINDRKNKTIKTEKIIKQ